MTEQNIVSKQLFKHNTTYRILLKQSIKIKGYLESTYIQNTSFPKCKQKTRTTCLYTYSSFDKKKHSTIILQH